MGRNQYDASRTTCLQLLEQNDFSLFQKYMKKFSNTGTANSRYKFLQQCLNNAFELHYMHFMAFVMPLLLELSRAPKIKEFQINPEHYHALRWYLSLSQDHRSPEYAILNINSPLLDVFNLLILEYADLPIQYPKNLDNKPFTIDQIPMNFSENLKPSDQTFWITKRGFQETKDLEFKQEDRKRQKRSKPSAFFQPSDENASPSVIPEFIKSLHSQFLRECDFISKMMVDDNSRLKFLANCQLIDVTLMIAENRDPKFLYRCQEIGASLNDEKISLTFIETFQRIHKSLLDKLRNKESLQHCKKLIGGFLNNDKSLTDSVMFEHLTEYFVQSPSQYRVKLGNRIAHVLQSAFDVVQSSAVKEEFSKLFRGISEMDFMFRNALEHCPINWMKAEPAVFELCLKKNYKAAAISWLASEKVALFIAFRNQCFIKRLSEREQPFRQLFDKFPEKHHAFWSHLEKLAMEVWKTFPIDEYWSVSKTPLNLDNPREYMESLCSLIEAGLEHYSNMSMSKDLAKTETALDGIFPDETNEEKRWVGLSNLLTQRIKDFIVLRGKKIRGILAHPNNVKTLIDMKNQTKPIETDNSAATQTFKPA